MNPNLGKNVSIVNPVNFGSEPYLITIGDDTTISFGCSFVTHDASVRVFKNLQKNKVDDLGGAKISSVYGKINIGKNCFIGCNTTVLRNVTIGDNCIIGAGSVVNHDIAPNTVAAGNPCKPICTIQEYFEKHKDEFDEGLWKIETSGHQLGTDPVKMKYIKEKYKFKK